jgi:WD40 repeat protein
MDSHKKTASKLTGYTGILKTVNLMKLRSIAATVLVFCALNASLARADKTMPDAELKSHTARVNGVLFSPDGTRLASVSDDGILKVWDMSTRKPLFSIESCGNHTDQLKFTADGKTLVALGSQNNIQVIDVTAGKLAKSMPVQNLPGGPAAMDLSPDGKTIAIVGRSTLRVIDLASGEIRYDYEVHKLYAINSVCFSPDGNFVATTATDDTALVIEIATGKIPRTCALDLKGQTVMFTRDGKNLMVYSTDQVLKSFNIETGDAQKLIDKGVSLVTLDLSKDGKMLAIGGCGRAPWLYSLPDAKVMDEAFDCEDRVMSAAISPDGKWLAGGANEGSIYLWKMPG